jgi:hypothetical protein
MSTKKSQNLIKAIAKCIADAPEETREELFDALDIYYAWYPHWKLTREPQFISLQSAIDDAAAGK